MRKTLIIKLGALGDVVRTTPLLRILTGDIYWVTNKESIPLLPVDGRVLKRVIDIRNAEGALRGVDFDLVLSLDDDFEAARLATNIKKDSLIGSFVDDSGCVAYTDSSREWFDMGIISRFGKKKADELKQANTKSYQEIIFKMLGKDFQGEEYLLNPQGILRDRHNKQPLIGIEERAGERWLSKKWNKYRQLSDILNQEGLKVRFFQERPTIQQYISDIGECDLVVCGDTLVMHIALALKIKVAAIFTCTSPTEIFDYGRMIKVVSPLLDKAFYAKQCLLEAVDAVSLASVRSAVDKLINNKVELG